MSQAQKNQEPSARVRTTPPPVPPRHSQIAQVARKASSTTPPPLAAHSRLPMPPKPSTAPRLSVPPPAHLALVPLWDDANLPLRPAASPQINETTFWVGSAAVSVAVGALVAASLMTLRFGDYAQIIPHGQAEPVAHAPSPELPLMAAGPVLAAVAAPVQTFEADQPLEIDLSEIEELAVAPQPIVIPELTVTSGKISKLGKSAKAAKQVKATPPYRAPKQRGKRGRRGRTMPAAQTAPQEEAPATIDVQSAPEPQAQTTETQPIEAAASTSQAPEQPQPEAPAPALAAEVAEEAPAPALPENLTRAQVKRGLDGVRAKVLACAHGTYGKILADVTISAPGQVSNTVIEGTFAGTKAAACMVQTIGHAKFPAFSGPDISVRYPYSF